MSLHDTTTIRIKNETRDQLVKNASFHDTYDQIISRLLKSQKLGATQK